MKLLLFILLCYGFSSLFAQASNAHYENTFIATNSVSKSNLPVLSISPIGYEQVPDSVSVLNCKVLKVFDLSSIFFYHSQVVLIDSARFFFFSRGCMTRIYSTGYYKWQRDTLQLSSDKNAARKIKRSMGCELRSRLNYEMLDDSAFYMNEGCLYRVINWKFKSTPN